LNGSRHSGLDSLGRHQGRKRAHHVDLLSSSGELSSPAIAAGIVNCGEIALSDGRHGAALAPIELRLPAGRGVFLAAPA